MGFGAGELVLIRAVLLFLGYGLTLPIVSIVMAACKKRRAARATGAVIWSSINLGLFSLGAGPDAIPSAARPRRPGRYRCRILAAQMTLTRRQ